MLGLVIGLGLGLGLGARVRPYEDLACGRAVREDHAHRGEERGEGLERALPQVAEERDERLGDGHAELLVAQRDVEVLLGGE